MEVCSGRGLITSVTCPCLLEVWRRVPTGKGGVGWRTPSTRHSGDTHQHPVCRLASGQGLGWGRGVPRFLGHTGDGFSLPASSNILTKTIVVTYSFLQRARLSFTG